VSAAGRSLVVVSAGLSQPSATRLLADRLSSATVAALERDGVSARSQVIEIRDHGRELINNLLSGFPPPALSSTLDAVVGADGLIAVTPIFSASYSGLFKTFFDLIERDGLSEKPVLLAATGGTARHSLAVEHAMRPLFAYFNAAVVPTAVFAAAEDWGRSDMPADSGLADRIVRAAGELAAAMARRQAKAVTDPFADPVPFDQLLRDVAGTPATEEPRSTD
jgi:FMN reductase